MNTERGKEKEREEKKKMRGKKNGGRSAKKGGKKEKKSAVAVGLSPIRWFHFCVNAAGPPPSLLAAQCRVCHAMGDICPQSDKLITAGRG